MNPIDREPSPATDAEVYRVLESILNEANPEYRWTVRSRRPDEIEQTAAKN
jgi:hypothetical protein